MTKEQAQEKDRGNVVVENNYHPTWGNDCYGEVSHFAYAFFYGAGAGNEATQYADQEYNSWTNDGRRVV